MNIKVKRTLGKNRDPWKYSQGHKKEKSYENEAKIGK